MVVDYIISLIVKIIPVICAFISEFSTKKLKAMQKSPGNFLNEYSLFKSLFLFSTVVLRLDLNI